MTDDVVKRFWRSLEEQAGGGPEPAMLDEAPARFTAAPTTGRRRFLQLVGASIAVPSLAACTRQPEEKIVPYVKQPEQLVPGRPLFYASSIAVGGTGIGVLVEAHEGRPTKLEGNPEHPTSLGGTDAIVQAEILQLYDPDRSQTVLHEGQIASWSGFLAAIQAAVLARRARRGEGLAILTGDTSSPTFIEQMRALLDEMPLARWYVHETFDKKAGWSGTRFAFGEQLDAVYHFDRADVIVSLDADFLASAEGNPRYVRDFAGRKHASATSNGRLARTYVIESQLSLTGANADHRLAVRAEDVDDVARLLGARLLAPEHARGLADGVGPPAGAAAAAIDAIAADLHRAGARAVVVPGRFQPDHVHAIAHAINRTLGSEAVTYADPFVASASDDARSLIELVGSLNAGEVQLLVVIGTNPAFTAPADVNFVGAVPRAKLRVHLGSHVDETAVLCHWHIPEAHPLEAWSDLRGHDGTIGVVQPVIEPLYGGKSWHELLGALGNQPDRSGYQIVREAWRAAMPGEGFEALWQVVLHDGLLRESQRSTREPGLALRGWPPRAEKPPAGSLEIVFRPDPFLLDGRYANNAWLCELPRSITQLTWDNALLVSPEDAQRLGIESEDVVTVMVDGRSRDPAVWVTPGQAVGSVTLHTGWGRERGGKVLLGAGKNAYILRVAGRWHMHGATLSKNSEKRALACAQTHHSMEGRDLVRTATADEYRATGHVPPVGGHALEGPLLSMYPDWPYRDYAWGMSIDLNRCVGCSACVAACQSENNVAVVGRSEVMRGREMHWIRIDRYFEGEPAAPRTVFQPVPCMQCENAPCEVVCPVQATVHHPEGLNDMVYNRCVGTKYCQNNCPYKVRRYNFFGYSTDPVAPMDPSAPVVRLLHNPDVTVRTYGVMEKCTYCVQRINYARIEAKKEDRPIRDGDVMTACQAACPARAITFGNINDKNSEVARTKAEPRSYAILADLNTRPRTTYLAKLGNPNPEVT
jgi:Fe-S-cluster-containing dehydrogenase component